MPSCHQCDGDVGAHGRDGKCSVCFRREVSFCQACAMWELGPMRATEDMFAALSPAPIVLSVSRSDDSEDSTSTHAQLPLECDAFLPKMGRACEAIDEQLTNGLLYGQSFQDYACVVLDNFRALYPTCKHDRAAIQILLVLYLSALERVQCRDSSEVNGSSTSPRAKFVKRWQVRTIARAHLVRHRRALRRHFGGVIRDAAWRPACQVALGLDDLEFMLKGFKTETTFAIDLLAAAGGSSDVAREAFEVAIIVYHSLVTARSGADLQGHWSQTCGSFKPQDALGCFSKDHLHALTKSYAAGQPFRSSIKKKINRVYQVLDDARPGNGLPAHPRYPGPGLSAALTAEERAYLGSLPPMSGTHGNRTQCERTVRRRVRALIEPYRNDWLKEHYALEPTFDVAALSGPAPAGSRSNRRIVRIFDPHTQEDAELRFRKSGVHVSKSLTPAHLTAIDDFVGRVAAGPNLRGVRQITIQVQGDSGNARRTTRYGRIVAALNDAWDDHRRVAALHPDLDDDAEPRDWSVGTHVDGLMDAMWNELRVDQAFDMSFADLVFQEAGHGRTIDPMAWFPLKTRDRDLSDVFGDCRFGNETFATVEDHYEATHGSSPRPAHYMDWRNHKDHWLYDCFGIEMRRRPLFASLSVQPQIPEPNPNYGGNFLLFRRDRINDRVVFTFGDKQQPRRSMLLLLDDLLYTRPKKDRTEGQAPASRQPIVDSLLARYEQIVLDRPAPPALDAEWAQSITGAMLRYPAPDLIIETQIFGPVTIANDALAMGVPYDVGLPLSVARDSADRVAETAALGAVYPQLTLLTYAPTAQNPNYGAPRTVLQPQSAARAALLDEKAKDHTT